MATGTTFINGSGPKQRSWFKNIHLHSHQEEDDGGEPKRTKSGSSMKPPKSPVASQIRASLFNSWINVLLIAVPVGIAQNFVKVSPVAIIVVNFIAIVPLAALLSFATEKIALRISETFGELLNASFGNAVELIVSIIALVQNQILIVQTSLIGSILSNLLLVLGMGFHWGGMRRDEQFFNQVVAQTAASLLALAAGSLIISTAFSSWATGGKNANEANVISLFHGTSVLLLLVYGCYLYFELKTHVKMYSTPSKKVEKRPRTRNAGIEAIKGFTGVGTNTPPTMSGAVISEGQQNGLANGAGKKDTKQQQEQQKLEQQQKADEDDDDDDDEEPQLSLFVAIFTLAASTVVMALCAEFMVNNIDAVVESSSISKNFVGLILLPIVGNAAEHATAVTVACDDKLDLAIGVAVGSNLQIALFVLPFIVTLGWALGKSTMGLNSDGFQIAVLFVAVLLVNYLIADGKLHWLEGVLLQTLYLIIAIAAWYYLAQTVGA